MTAVRRLAALTTFCLTTVILGQGPGTSPSATDGSPEERRVYLVFFEEKPLATYRGGVAGLEATHPRSRGERRLDPDSSASRAYLRFLERRQDERLAAMRAALGSRPQLLQRYLAAGNAVALRLRPAEAWVVGRIPGVVRVVQDYDQPLDTDRGPSFIGAPSIWDGSESGGTATLGEGAIVGVIDTGVNMLHPSFSDTPVDGYVYTNPLGSGNYLGWCDPSHPNFQASFICNDKLIGAWDFVDAISVDNDGPHDSDGHGSHTASTAAGNRLDYSGDGVPDLSGVAPHANLITYDVCYVDATTGQGLCPFSATSAAVNQIILDGVDAVNYSIGGGTAPWSDIDAFFLDAVAAGVFVATSAGNSGPGAGTVAHLGPWVSSVAASTHDRVQSEISLVNMSGGGSAPADIAGLSRTGGYGPSPIVYAGDFSNATSNPEQCLVAFPPGTWSGEIVVCDRGGIARVMKGQNVFLGGAGALVLANVNGGSTTLADDPHLIPAIHVEAADGGTLRTWLGSGSGHTATLTASTLITDPSVGDLMASFSSRGPNNSFDVLKPDLSNPGVNILAAVATDFFDEPGLLPYQGLELFFLSGTSMSSPHTAGAGALLRALRPSWTPLQVKSALMTTARTVLLKEDGTTPADPFDVGAGRVDLSRAGRAGLLFDETHANLLAANPAVGGDPATLNIPSLMSSACPGVCSWTRTVESSLPSSVTWTTSFSGPSWMTITVQPASFLLAPGASQTLDIEVAGATLGALGVWAFGQVTLTPDDSSVPEAHLPVAVNPSGLPVLVVDAAHVDDTFGNADGIADPHEIITLTVDLGNIGGGDASTVGGVLTTITPGVSILDGSATWPSVVASAVQGSQSPHFQFRIDGSVPCGTLIDFDLDVSTAQGSFPLSFQQEVGLSVDPSGLYLSLGEPLAIPDKDPAGIQSTIAVPDSFTIGDIHVAVNITHPRVGDLEVDLTSPGGTTVRLHDGSGGNRDDIITTYDLVTAPDGPGSMSDFDGEDVGGMWTLTVVDAAINNTGLLNNWSLTVDGVFSLTCAPVPCAMFAQAAAAPGLVCGGEAATLSDVGSFEVGEDCGGTLEYRFSDGALIQDWSADPDAVVFPALTTVYSVDVRDATTLAADTAMVTVEVLPAPAPAIVQSPDVVCSEGVSVNLDAGAGFVSYSWQDDLATVIGTSQVLSLGLEACGRSYTATVEGVNGCFASESHPIVCQTCTPPEVSGSGTLVPFRMGLDAAGTIEFELLPDPDVTYNLYQADTIAEILAGEWGFKYCDLSSPVLGTWTPIGPDTVRWTPIVPVLVFEGHWVVVAERFGYEGSYGPRPSDTDGAGSVASVGCP